MTDTPSSMISTAERGLLVEELAVAAAGIEPFTVQIGSMLSYHSGVIADVSPDGEIARLYEVVHEAIQKVRGDAAVRYPFTHPHLTISYALAEADSDDAQRKLRRVRPSHAPLRVDAIHLVDVAATAGTVRTITWDHLTEIPLGHRRG